MPPALETVETPDTIQVDGLIARAVALRNRIKELKEAFDEKLKPFTDAQDQVHGTLLQFLEESGQTQAKSKSGLVFIKDSHTSPLTDPDAFMAFVREHDLFELLTRAANSTAVMEYAETHDGTLPPGVKINTFRRLNVRASNDQ